jgi:hypothetical protein
VFGKLTANVEIAGPFKIETKPYTVTIASKTDVSSSGSTTSTETNAPAEPETAATEPVAEKESAVEKSVTSGNNPILEAEPTEVTPATDIEEAEVPADVKGGNWTVVSVAVGVSAAAAGVVILKITKII